MRQSSGNMDGLGSCGVASPAMALVTLDGTIMCSSCEASLVAAAAASAASYSALLAKRISCLTLKR